MTRSTAHPRRRIGTALLAVTASGALLVSGAVAPATAAPPPAKGEMAVSMGVTSPSCNPPAGYSSDPVVFSSNTAARTIKKTRNFTVTDPLEPTDVTKVRTAADATAQFKAANGALSSFRLGIDSQIRMTAAEGKASACDTLATISVQTMSQFTVKRTGRLTFTWSRGASSLAQIQIVREGGGFGPGVEAEVNITAGGPANGTTTHRIRPGTYTLQAVYQAYLSETKTKAGKAKVQDSGLDATLTYRR